ncbi:MULTISPECIES: phosphate acyltransferase PlsX [unclassified Butyrivibrio]|uniref:phosphate acyltransferase PlsX n=1 Tax=unclassified Butyrivibrio TaxID=2639466 RepID=UPI0003B42823|nr:MULTISPECIES: phosphate acyltransferase PlsX [unclassified Butyrivibrio]SDB48986.1 phosphate:acyl-[acyl carrier protein] acyltransferase [Butyrivibrio sp. INlla16]SEK48086.1 phosphate:acyl-[acyl carrier protein] acyltransferase [Butyrivibrio sp. ob235]
MAELVKVALDAMGGDNAPGEIIKGAVDALEESDRLKIFFVGKEQIIKDELSKYTYDESRVEIVNAEEVIEMAEPPVMAIRTKKDSSIVKAMFLVKHGECDAYVSAGSTGATLVGGQVIIGRIKGVERSPLAPLIPTENGVSLLIDCGANVDARPSHLVQFAKMGSVYMENVCGIKNPRVGIVNIGAEEEKGNALVKETFPLLKNCPDINFIGSVEARDIPYGVADVIVCEAFTGNVILKMYEGVATALLKVVKKGLMSSLRAKIGGLLIKPALKDALKDYDMNQYGGAPMLGLTGLVVKTHGSAKAVEVKNSILQCVTFKEQNIAEKIKESILSDT